MALLRPCAQLGWNGKHRNTPLCRTTWPFRNGSTRNVWVSAQLSLQMTHQILQSLHLGIGARWRRWWAILLHLQSDQPLFGSTDAGNDCRALASQSFTCLLMGTPWAAVSARFNAARNPSTSGPSVSPNVSNACCNICTRSTASTS